MLQVSQVFKPARTVVPRSAFALRWSLTRCSSDAAPLGCQQVENSRACCLLQRSEIEGDISCHVMDCTPQKNCTTLDPWQCGSQPNHVSYVAWHSPLACRVLLPQHPLTLQANMWHLLSSWVPMVRPSQSNSYFVPSDVSLSFPSVGTPKTQRLVWFETSGY